MKRSYSLFVLLLTVLLVGCVKKGNSFFSYSEPQLNHVATKKVVNLPFTQAWYELIAQLKNKRVYNLLVLILNLR